MSGFECIDYAVESGRARITLNRPEKRNALSRVLLEEVREAVAEADADRDVHCLIVRGAGASFCAGYDLGEGVDRRPVSRVSSESRRYRGGRSLDDDAWQLEWNQRLLSSLFDAHIPSIAQVHGHCLAGGTDLALYCDMVIVADDAKIGFPPARDLGALPNNFWIYHLGPQWSKRLLLTGDTINGREAQELGFAMKSVPLEDLENEVEQLADRLALIDPDLLSANKRVVNLAMELMGARTLQRLAAENDVRGHNTRAAKNFMSNVQEQGLRDTLRARDARFGDGRARVHGPERRDAEGRLLEDEPGRD